MIPMNITDLLFPLNRPEYPRTPEVLQSALAWSLDRERQPGEASDGLVYEKRVESSAKGLTIRQARPGSGEEASLLGELGLEFLPTRSAHAADGLWDGLRGVVSSAAKAYPVVPLTVGLALLQNAVGVHAKSGPPNFAEIIEQVYRAGNDVEVDRREAARLWYRAVNQHGADSVLPFLDKLAGRLLEIRIGRNPLSDVAETVRSQSAPALPLPPAWLGQSTPMHWFYRSWRTLCSDEWRAVLPARRWTDWASCVLRTGIGLTFLWEARFLKEFGRCLLASSPREAAAARFDRSLPLLRWRSSALPLSIRDENSNIIQTAYDGTRIRAMLGDLLAEADQPPPPEWRSAEGLVEFAGWFQNQ